MYLGAITGFLAAFLMESALMALLFAFLAGMAGAALYAFITVTLKANQNVTGLTLTIFGSGVANFFGGAMNKLAGGVGQISVAITSGGYRATIKPLANLGAFGQLFFSYGFTPPKRRSSRR